MEYSNPLLAFLRQENSSTSVKSLPLFCLLFFAVLNSANAQNIIYVNHAATGGNNGTSWADAFAGLQNAIDVAEPGDQIWVAQGVYKPTEKHGGTSDRHKTFYINKEGIEIYGGFSGTEDSLSQRDFVNNATILSGDLDNNDTDADGDFVADSTTDIVGDNAIRVLRMDTVGNLVRLDGFTITAGFASGGFLQGGGLYIVCEADGKQSSPTIANCIFSGNYAYSGGGVHNRALNGGLVATSFEHCTFTYNLGFATGGAVQNFGDNATVSPTFSNCFFKGNEATNASGGAISNLAQSNGTASPVLSSCTFVNNLAETGGAIFNSNADPIVNNCIFESNAATLGGGAMYNTGFSNSKVANCIFLTNIAAQDGGAIANIVGNPVIVNCSFYGNSANIGSTISNFSNNPTIANCIIWNNAASSIFNSASGGAIPQISHTLLKENFCPPGAICGNGMIFNQDPLFADAENGDLRLLAGSPAIDAGDTSAVPPGITTDLDGKPRIFNSTGLPVAIVDLGAYEFDKLISNTYAPATRHLQLSVSPNPARSIANLQFYASTTGQGTLQVFSLEGQLVIDRAIPVSVGTNLFPLPVEALPPGVYAIQIRCSSKGVISGVLVKT